MNSEPEKPSVPPTNDPRNHGLRRAARRLPTGDGWGVPERVWRQLWTGEGVSPGWGGVRAILNAFVSADVTDANIIAVLTDPENVGATYVHTRSSGAPRARSDAERMVRNGIRSSRRFVARQGGDRYEAIMRAVRFREAALDQPARWVGRAGGTDLAVLLALAELAAEAGRWELHADVRTLAERAGVGVASVSRSLARLRAGDRPWIRRIAIAGGVNAAKYRLSDPETMGGGTQRNNQPVVVPRDKSVPMGTAGLDVWRWAGLGKAAFRTYSLLGGEPVTTSDLAAALGVSPRSARKHLATLALYGLATKANDVGWVRGDVDPQAVGEAMPAVAGRGDAERERHRREREGRAAYVAHKRRLRAENQPQQATIPGVVVVPLPDGGTVTITVPKPATATASGIAPATG